MRRALITVAVLATALVAAPAPTDAAVAPARTAASSEPSVTTERLAVSTLKKRVIALTNKKRVNRGCRRVKANAALGRAAQKHSKKMAVAQDLSHQLPGEANIRRRYLNEGYNPGWWGENIAFNQRSARAVVTAWWNSAPHKANILNCHYKHIGIGYAVDAQGQPYWTQDFGSKR